MKKEKIKLPNGLTIFYYQKEQKYKSGNTKLFDMIEIRDGRELLLLMDKQLTFNGNPVEGDWGY